MKVKSLPYSINFSRMQPFQIEALAQEMTEDTYEQDIDKEIILLRTLSMLRSDKEKCILLLEILREYGFQIDYNSIAQSLGIHLRWYMRIKKSIKEKIILITTNENR